MLSFLASGKGFIKCPTSRPLPLCLESGIYFVVAFCTEISQCQGQGLEWLRVLVICVLLGKIDSVEKSKGMMVLSL